MKSKANKTIDIFYRNVNSQQQEGPTSIPNNEESFDLEINLINDNEQNPNSEGQKRFATLTIETDQLQKISRVESCDKTNSYVVGRDLGLCKQIYAYPSSE